MHGKWPGPHPRNTGQPLSHIIDSRSKPLLARMEEEQLISTYKLVYHMHVHKLYDSTSYVTGQSLFVLFVSYQREGDVMREISWVAAIADTIL